MDFDEVVRLMGSEPVNAVRFAQLQAQLEGLHPNRKAAEQCLRQQSAALLELMGSNNVRAAVALCRALLVLFARQAFEEYRRIGVFRASKHHFKNRVARAVVRDCLQHHAAFAITPEDVNYLNSVLSLLEFAGKVRKVYDGVQQVVGQRKKLVLKTLWAALENLFATRFVDGPGSDDTAEMAYYSNEDLAEAFSYILTLHRDRFGVVNKAFQHVDESALNCDLYAHLFVDAAKICKFKEAELLLDGFPYQVVGQGSYLRLESIDPRLEQSIRYGYIQTVQQMYLRRMGLERHLFDGSDPKRPASIRQFAESCYAAGKGELIFLCEQPIARYVLMLPPTPELFKPFSDDALFEEDIEALVQLGIENYDYASLKNIEVRDGITAVDILKMQRLFRFVSVIFQCALADHEQGDVENVALRSVLPVFTEAQLRQYVESVLPDKDHQKLLALLALDLANAEHVDIQYAPLVKLDGFYVVAPAIVANSNLVRNVFCANHLKQPFAEGIDPMQDAIAKALESQGFRVAQEVMLTYRKKQMETDIVAFKDGQLFLIECKNAYHPCNVHEMRNSYEHIAYAAHQLTLRKQWLATVQEQQRLFDAAGFDTEQVTAIHTCIATANRVFNGFELDGHPVRQGHELINLIGTGVVNIAGVARRVWVDEHFDTTDLLAYLRGDTTIKDCLESMVSTTAEYHFKDGVLAFSTCYLDGGRLLEVSRRYPPVS